MKFVPVSIIAAIAFLSGCSSNSTQQDWKAKEEAAVTINFSGDILPIGGMSWQSSGIKEISFTGLPAIQNKNLSPEKRLQMKVTLNYELELDTKSKSATLNIVGGLTQRCTSMTFSNRRKSTCKSVEDVKIQPAQLTTSYGENKSIALTSEVNLSFLVEDTDDYTYKANLNN